MLDFITGELRTHLEMAEADRIARGGSPSDAVANARRESATSVSPHVLARRTLVEDIFSA